MRKRDARIEAMRQIDREYGVAVAALDALTGRLAAEPSFLAARRLEQVDFDHFARHLESTYVVRLYAEFEETLREYWAAVGKPTQPPMRDLLTAITSRRRVSDELFRAADALARPPQPDRTRRRVPGGNPDTDLRAGVAGEPPFRKSSAGGLVAIERCSPTPSVLHVPPSARSFSATAPPATHARRSEP